MIGGLAVTARHVIGEDLGLIPEWCDEAIDAAPMLGTFTHDIDGLVVDRSHMVIDHDGALDRKAGPQAEFAIRPDARPPPRRYRNRWSSHP